MQKREKICHTMKRKRKKYLRVDSFSSLQSFREFTLKVRNEPKVQEREKISEKGNLCIFFEEYKQKTLVLQPKS
jgi:hypothetical protein